MTKIKLQTSDNRVLEVDIEVAKVSKTICTMIEDRIYDIKDIIPLPNVTSKVLALVVRWSDQHKDDPKQIQPTEMDCDRMNHHQPEPHRMNRYLPGSDRMNRNQPEQMECDQPATQDEWDAEFFQIDQNTLFDLLTAANYLDIPDLVSAISVTIASLIKGKRAEEIRVLFNIRNDFAEAEYENVVKQENAFLFD